MRRYFLEDVFGPYKCTGDEERRPVECKKGVQQLQGMLCFSFLLHLCSA